MVFNFLQILKPFHLDALLPQTPDATPGDRAHCPQPMSHHAWVNTLEWVGED